MPKEVELCQEPARPACHIGKPPASGVTTVIQLHMAGNVSDCGKAAKDHLKKDACAVILTRAAQEAPLQKEGAAQQLAHRVRMLHGRLLPGRTEGGPSLGSLRGLWQWSFGRAQNRRSLTILRGCAKKIPDLGTEPTVSHERVRQGEVELRTRTLQPSLCCSPRHLKEPCRRAGVLEQRWREWRTLLYSLSVTVSALTVRTLLSPSETLSRSSDG